MSIYQDALAYARDFHFSVLPLHGVNADGSCTCGNSNCGKSTGKHPVISDWTKSATSVPFVIKNWFDKAENRNVGIATGAISGIFVLDVDGMEGEQSLAAMPPLPKTMTSLTGRGRHLLFRHPGYKIVTRSSSLGKGLDVRGDGGQFVAPPSRHYSGTQYRWDESCGYEIAYAPQWLLDLVKDTPPPAPVYVPAAASNDERWPESEVMAMLQHILPDCGYDDWIAIGMALHDGGYPFAMFDAWSGRGTKYNGSKDCQTHWRSFKPCGGITMGTLVDRARLGGWIPSPGLITQSPDYENGKQSAAALLVRYDALPQNASLHDAPSPISSAHDRPLPSRVPVSTYPGLEPGIIADTVDWIACSGRR